MTNSKKFPVVMFTLMTVAASAEVPSRAAAATEFAPTLGVGLAAQWASSVDGET